MVSTTSFVGRLVRRLFRKRAKVRSLSPFVRKKSRADIALRIDSVSKRYRIYHQAGFGLLKALLFPGRREQYFFEFKAVDNVTLDVERGEVVGVIGANGAGKTTLLKMVAGLLPIDDGSIEIHGRVTAVMTMGAGVHPEFTGRENILYGAMLLGMSKREVLARTPRIIDFAELGDYIDRPLRTYSSGMAARLLFSIAMTVDPDILIVDEALATGDQRFVLKCINRIREFCDAGATIIFVSHDMGLVQNLCHRAVVMDQGRIVFMGKPGEAIERYQGWSPTAEVSESVAKPLQLVGGTGQITITHVRLFTAAGEESHEVPSGDSLHIEIDYRLNDLSLEAAHVAVGFLRASDQIQIGEVSTWHTRHVDHSWRTPMIELQPEGRIIVHVEPLLLVSDYFLLHIRLFDRSVSYCEYRSLRKLFVRENGALINQAALFKHPGRIYHDHDVWTEP